MLKNFPKKRSLLLIIFISGVFLFAGCDIGGGENKLIDTPPLGFWVSAYQEGYLITEDELICYFQAEEPFSNMQLFYKGNIKNIRQEANGSGYITIQYTKFNAFNPNDNDLYLGNFYVIHWKNRTGGSVEISACSDGLGKTTQAEAESEYTTGNAAGYFTFYSSAAKTEFPD